MTLQELKNSCVARFNQAKEQAEKFIKEQKPKAEGLLARLSSVKASAMTKRAATAKLFIEIDEKDNVKISIEGKKKDLSAALNKILGA